MSINERTENNFLIYANSVIKARAIPNVEDNLKPIHRRILYTLWEDKVTSDKPTKKCATEVGRVLAYSPHGDASVYGALVRLGQWWKVRYPLVEIQGNCGNILGDGPAASRYTECRLSPVGMLMLEELKQNSVDFKPNYDNTTEEPIILPSKFPYLLCGNNSGIAVGMSSDLVSHNFTEVKSAIEYYLDNQNCTIADLMQFIKGPDFPTGGKIVNAEELHSIYTTGRGSIRVQAHYDIVKKGSKTLIIFHDLPYGTEIDSGVKEPLKRLVIEDGYEIFEDIQVEKVNKTRFDITVVLGKNADVNKCLEILFQKTKLANTIKINQTVIVNGEPKILNLKDLIQYWVKYRSNIIKRIALHDYDINNHKLTVNIGLQKCMSDIDMLIKLIRESDNRAAAKIAIIKAFELNEEQADAVLDMKLSRLNRLDLTELNENAEELSKKLTELKDIIDNEHTRYTIIKKQLNEVKQIIGKDERLTEISYSQSINRAGDNINTLNIRQELKIYSDGLHSIDINAAAVKTNNIVVEKDLQAVTMGCGAADVVCYTKKGEMFPLKNIESKIDGVFANTDAAKNKLVAVTKNGNIKASLLSDYKMNKVEKVLKLKDADELIYANICNDNDYIILFSEEMGRVLKIAVSELPVATKLTVGVKSGFASISAAACGSDNDLLFFMNDKNQAKLTYIKDLSVDSRGNKGQLLAENTKFMTLFEKGREYIYLEQKSGKITAIPKNKMAIKGKTAIGAVISSASIVKVI